MVLSATGARGPQLGGRGVHHTDREAKGVLNQGFWCFGHLPPDFPFDYFAFSLEELNAERHLLTRG